MMTFVLQDGWSPLIAASRNGHFDVVKTLLEAGANINQATQDGRTSLDLAVKQGHKATIQLLKTYQNKVIPPTLVQSAEKRAARDEQAPSNTKLQNTALVIPQAQQTQEGANKAEENRTPEQEILKPMQQNDMFQLQITHQAQHANERARIADERATRVKQELSETKLHYEALLQQIQLQAHQADEKAEGADKRANQELLETKQHYDALQQQIRLQVELSEERATRAEQELLQMKQQRDALQQETRVQVQHADERARRAEERASTAEKEHLETKQQRDAMQQQMRLQVQHADERAARTDQQISDYMMSSWRVEQDEIEETGEEPFGVGGWGEVRVAMFRGQQKEQTEQQLHDMRQQKEQTELWLHDIRQQKEQTEQQLHDIRQQKEQTEQQLHDIRQQKEQTEQQLKEQIDVSERRLQTITKMQIKNKTLKRELREMVQKADAGHITQTANFMDYNLMNSSVSINSSDDGDEDL
ncbi:hypothetical protein EMCRGX_G004966 [Ephydatia muelleri]|eukprot:Em0007g870a